MVPPRNATIAAVLGLPLAIFLHGVVGWYGYLPTIVVLWLIGIPLCARAARILHTPDPREVSYDEIISMPVVFFLSPSFSWPILITGFLLHRFFDIFKPLGVRRLERLHGGLGIMSDDMLAAVYGFLVLQLLVFVGLVR